MSVADIQRGRLKDTRSAFDGVAPDYDGALGNNHVIQRMRQELWKTVESVVPSESRLLDIGCGTGLDAVHFGELGYDVTATDWSPEMVGQTLSRIGRTGLQRTVRARVLGAQDIAALPHGSFDGIYSDLGPLNCVPDLADVARGCALTLRPSGYLIASVIGRFCPWEFLYYVAHGNLGRATIRWSRQARAVPLVGETVWTRYYAPREFFRPFIRHFTLSSFRPLGLFAPPPYLLGAWTATPRLCAFASDLDAELGRLPGLRSAGDHFLIVMKRRG